MYWNTNHRIDGNSQIPNAIGVTTINNNVKSGVSITPDTYMLVLSYTHPYKVIGRYIQTKLGVLRLM